MSKNLICLVLSLPDSNERRAGITSQLDRFGIPFEFVDGVDARQGLPAEFEAAVDRATAARRIGRQMMDPEIGCALGQVRLLKRFLESDAERALVLEDDAILLPDLTRFLDNGGARLAPLIMLFHGFARVRRRGALAAPAGVMLHKLAIPSYGTCGFIVDRRSAQALIASQTPVRGLADWPMDVARLGARVAIPRLIDHPDEEGQSQIGGDRPNLPRHFPIGRYLTFRHLVRQWDKATAIRVS